MFFCIASIPATPTFADNNRGFHVPTPDESGWRDIWQDAGRERVKKYDPAYQEGKAIFLGAGPRPDFNYCVPTEPIAEAQPTLAPELKPISRKTLKPFRKMEVGLFANQLIDCDEPRKKVLSQLPKEEAGLVIYYLSREYSLHLKQPDGPGEKARRFSQSDR